MVWSCPMDEPLVHLEMISSPWGWWRFGAVNPKILLGNHKQLLLPSSQFMVLSCFCLLCSRTPCLWHCKWSTGWRQVCSLVSIWVCSPVLTMMAVPAQGLLGETNSSCRMEKTSSTTGADFAKTPQDPGAPSLQPHPTACHPPTRDFQSSSPVDSPNMWSGAWSWEHFSIVIFGRERLCSTSLLATAPLRIRYSYLTPHRVPTFPKYLPTLLERGKVKVTP